MFPNVYRRLERPFCAMLQSTRNLQCIFVVILLCSACLCQGPGSYTATEMRLTGGESPNEGRLEFRLEDPNIWHTVCSPYFADNLPSLICPDLGWPYSIPCSKAIPSPIDLPVDNLGLQILSVFAACLVDATSLSECAFVNYEDAPSTCTHDDDVWIQCLADSADYEVRLVDGKYTGEGYVQTRCPDSNWTTVCDNGLWDLREAEVVCRQLGLSWAYGTDPEGPLTTTIGDVAVNNVLCSGNEDVFGDCTLKNVDSQCYDRIAPGVECGEYYEHNDVTVSLCGCHHCGHPLATNPFSNPKQCCKCDCACVSIGDCCADFDAATHCGLDDPSDADINGVDISLYDCHGVPGSERNNYAYVLVSRCPGSWMDINTRLLCEVRRNLTDVVGVLPVIDSNNVTYKNIFCAFCHEKSINEVTFWEVEEQRRSHFGPLEGYRASWPNTHSNARPRSCPFDFVDRCPEETTDSKVIASCQSYFAPFSLDGHPKPYRNPHCAICNEVTDELSTEYCVECQVSCPFGFPENACTPAICPRLDNFLTVAVLFDFSDLENNEFENGASVTCKEGTVYDPFLKTCRSLSCPPEFVLKDSTCEPLNPPDPVISDTEVIGSPEALRSFSCIVDVFGFTSTADVGAIEILTREVRHQITTCKAVGIGCEVAETSKVSVAFLFENNIPLLMKLKDAMESVLITDYINEDNGTVAIPICNVTSVSTYVRYSKEYALPSECEPFQANSSVDFDVDINSDILLSFSQYNFDQGTNYYEELISPVSCLVPTSLNCSTSITLNQTEYVLMTDESVNLLALNATIPRHEYLLLSDGDIIICSFTQSPTASTSKRSVLDIIAAVCQLLSVVALLITFITYLIFSSLRNLPGKAVMSLVVALCLGYLCLLLSGVFLFNSFACAAVAVLAHYFWLAAFTWMMLFAANIAKTFSRRGASSRHSGTSSFWKYMLLGWSLPAVVVGVCVGLHVCQCTSMTFQYGNIEENTCFLRGARAILLSFVVPISTMLLLSISCFLFMAIQLRLKRSASKLARSGGTAEEISFELAIYLRLSSVIGLTWVFAYIFILLPNNVAVNYIYVILNSLQGVFIFFAFACTSRVRGMWKSKMKDMTGSSNTTRSTPATSGKSEGRLSESKGLTDKDTRV